MLKPIKARTNPFRSERVEAFRYRIDADVLEDWRKRLFANRQVRWSIVGPEGSGKTILLEDLAAGIDSLEWIKIRKEDALKDKIRAGFRVWQKDPKPLFLDGAETLPRIFLGPRILIRPKIIVTLHHRRRSLRILHRTCFDPAVILELFETLTGKKPNHEQSECLIQISREKDGNIREVIRALYWEASEGRNPLGIFPEI